MYIYIYMLCGDTFSMDIGLVRPYVLSTSNLGT
jgi:hypothetical protein